MAKTPSTNGKGSAPRNCFSQAFRDNYDVVFRKPKKPRRKTIKQRLSEYWVAWFARPNKDVYYTLDQHDPTLRADLARYRIKNLGKDGLCQCSCADVCPVNKCGSMTRCSRTELESIL
jgi:hypothetical protein